jgi:hypothetical protein
VPTFPEAQEWQRIIRASVRECLETWHLQSKDGPVTVEALEAILSRSMVPTVYPDLVTRTASGEVQTVKYQELIPMLLNELQRQRQALQSQQKELAELRALVGQGRGKVVLGGIVE